MDFLLLRGMRLISSDRLRVKKLFELKSNKYKNRGINKVNSLLAKCKILFERVAALRQKSCPRV